MTPDNLIMKSKDLKKLKIFQSDAIDNGTLQTGVIKNAGITDVKMTDRVYPCALSAYFSTRAIR